MKLYDQKTQDLARVVQDVLEGKVKKECADEKDFKPHMMYDPKTGKGYKANTYDDHVRMDKMGYTHDKPKDIDEMEVAYKKDRERLKDGSNDKKVTNLRPESVDVEAAHEEALAIEEARQLKDPKKEVMVVKNNKVEVINKKDLKKYMKMGYGLAEDTITISLPSLFNEKKATIDLDFSDGGNKEMKRIEKKYKVKYKERKDGGFDVTGDTKNLHKLLKGDEYQYDKDEIKDMFPEVLEAKDIKEEEMSAKQKAYKKVFDGALKKFGVKSPAELEGDKKKEFFDYVDAQYDAGENETD